MEPTTGVEVVPSLFKRAWLLESGMTTSSEAPSFEQPNVSRGSLGFTLRSISKKHHIPFLPCLGTVRFESLVKHLSTAIFRTLGLGGRDLLGKAVESPRCLSKNNQEILGPQ